jgi:uncharacterized membrane protein
MEWLLLILLVAGFFYARSAHRALTQRIETLEDAVERLHAPSAAAPERSRAPAFVEPRPPAEALSRAAGQPTREWAGSLSKEPIEEERDPAPSESLAGLFERLVGGRLLIWTGGAALVLAAVFLIRHSIEIGLVTPELRMITAGLFGLFLLGAGEYAHRGRFLADDPRVGQALVGAGLAILYATAYGSHILYGMIGTATAAGAMLVVTVTALFLSLRRGAPTALMGLAGGFLTPLLVGSGETGAVPLLVYLAFVNAAVFGIALRRGWAWLAAAAVALSFLWTGALIAAGSAELAAIGAFVIVLTVAAATAHPGEGRELKWLHPLGIALVQLAYLAAADSAPLAWALYGSLAAASLALAALRPEQSYGPPIALALALMLLIGSRPGDPLLPWAAVGTTLLFVGGAAALALRGCRWPWVPVAASALALPALIVRTLEPGLLLPAGWGALLAGLALAGSLLAWSQRAYAKAEGAGDLGLLAAAGAATLLAVAAGWDLVPGDLVPAAWLAVAIGLGLAARNVRDVGLVMLLAAVVVLAVLRALYMVPELSEAAVSALLGFPVLTEALPSPAAATTGLLIPAALIVLLWRALPDIDLGLRRALPMLAGAFAVAASYVLFKQLFGLENRADFAARGFAERTMITQALFAVGWLVGSVGIGRRWLDEAQRRLAAAAFTALATARLFWFDMLMHNPLWVEQYVGALPVLNLLLPAFLLSALWLYAARRRAARPGAEGIWLALFLASLGLGVMLMARQIFQGPVLSGPALPLAEFYVYSLAGLLLSVTLLGAGIRIPDKALRVAGLGALTLTILKVFLVDASELEGVLRILSFLGLGVALIGIGKLYSTVLKAEARPARATGPGSELLPPFAADPHLGQCGRAVRDEDDGPRRL